MAIDISTFPPPPRDPDSKLKVAAREAAGFIAGGIEGITEAAGGLIKGTGKTIDYAANIFNRLGGQREISVFQKATTPVGNFIIDKANEGFDAAQEIIEQKSGKESVLAGPTKWVGREIAAPLITYQGLVGKAGKIKNIFSALKNSSLSTTTKKGLGIVEKVLPYASQSIARTEIQRASSTGRPATIQELGVGLIADTAFSTVGHFLKKMGPELFRIGINPQGKNAKDIVSKATAAVNKGYVGTMKQIEGQANKVITKASGEMDNLLKGKGATIARSEIIKQGDEFIKRAAATGDETAVRAVTQRLEQFARAGKKKITPQDALNLKRTIAKQITSIFDKGVTADPKIAAQKQALVALWEGLDKAIGKISPKVAKLNEDMNLAFSLLDPIEKSLRKPIVNTGNLIGIFRSLPTATIGSTGAQLTKGLGAAAGSDVSRFATRSLTGQDGQDEGDPATVDKDVESSGRRVPIPSEQTQGSPDVNFEVGSLF